MNARRKFPRFMIYALLCIASLVFMTPLIWLVSTSLKPIEQVMSLPPSLIPRIYTAPVDGERVEVLRDFTLRQPGVVADVLAESPGGATLQRRFFSPEEAKARAEPLRAAHPVEAGWVHVTVIDGGSAQTGRWDVVPPATIKSRIQFRWKNYPAALAALGGAEKSGGVSAWVLTGNTLLVCVLGVIGTVFSNAMVAYGFARLRWRGRDAFFALTLATMMVPFPVLMVPLYGVFKTFGWIGTLLPLWVPSFFGSAFNIFLMRQFFRTVPEELSEAARIDGCSEWRIFWRVILPLSKPVLVTAGVLHFLFAWNDFLGPLLYLTRKETFTLSLALQSFQSQQGGVQWHHLMAASAFTILPVVILFFFAQKVFVQGIATTGSKG